MQTKLILIEGMPGSGKTTTTIQLGECLQQKGFACRWYLEDDDPHPIDCLDFALKDLVNKMPALWRNFVKQVEEVKGLTIIESRLWQNTAMFMYMAEYPVSEIMKYHQLVWRELSPLSPLLVHLYQENVEDGLKRIFSDRGEQWINKALKTTGKYQWFQGRSNNDIAGWVDFFKEWGNVAVRLYQDWPYRKISVRDPHHDWESSFSIINQSLDLENH